MALTQLAAELAERAERLGPITIGLAGAGQMGTDIVVQVALMPGVRIGAISEVRPLAAIDAALLAGHDRGDIVEASTPNAIDGAIERGKIAVTSDLNASPRPVASTSSSTPPATPISARSSRWRR